MLMVGLAFPIGGDLFHQNLHVLGIDEEGAFFAVGQVLHDLNIEVAVDFGIEDAVAPELAHATGQKLIRGDVDGHLFRHVLEGLGPAQGQQLAFGLAHGLRKIPGTLNIDVGDGELNAIQNLVDPFAAFTVDLFLALKTFFLRGKTSAL